MRLVLVFVTAVAALPYQHRLRKSSSESRALESRHEAGGLEARMAQMERSMTEHAEQILNLKKRIKEQPLVVDKLKTGNAAVSRAPPRASPTSPTRPVMVLPWRRSTLPWSAMAHTALHP